MEPRTSARASARLGRPAAVDRRSEDGRFPRGHVAHARSNSSDNRGLPTASSSGVSPAKIAMATPAKG